MSAGPLLAQQSPRPFNEIPGLWLKITEITEEFFTREAPRASVANTLISLLIVAAATTLLSAISSLTGGSIQAVLPPSEYWEATLLSYGSIVLCSMCVGVFGTFIGFYLSNAFVYIGARLFGGTGDFTTQTYLQSLFYVPIGIATGVVNLIPCVGPIAAIGLAIYAIVLNVRSIKVDHSLSTGRAVAAIFVPALVIGLFVVCIVMGLLAIMGPMINSFYENIITNIY